MRDLRCGLAIAVMACAACGGGGKSFRSTGGTGGSGAGGMGGRISWNRLPNSPRNVDILFMIDDSSSMRLAQNSLLASFPTFVSTLQGLPGGVPNVHLAVVSQDMGAGDGSISGCDASGGKKGIFQYGARGTCTATNLQAGATYISNVGGVANYSGNLADVFSCIAALGESGCGFEHQLAAILRALGADGNAAPAENQGFLRPDAALAIVMLTNEDDCSASPGIQLFDTNSNLTIASQFGPPSNFRCNEFGHLCSMGTGPLMHPSRSAPGNDMNTMVTYDMCQSDESDGFLLSVTEAADRIKALKADVTQIAVVSIQGQPTPYTVHWRAPSVPDTSCGAASCPWPEITHSCTASDGSFGDPGVRTAQFVGQFGSKGLVLPICATSLPLGAAAELIGTLVAPPCIDSLIADDPAKPGVQPDCKATLHQANVATNMYVDTSIAACADNGGAAPCWTLTKEATCAGASVHVTLDPATAKPSDTVTFSCVPCADTSQPAGCF